MAQQPDISAILAALAAQRPSGTPAQTAQAGIPLQLPIQNFGAGLQAATPQHDMQTFSLPQPISSGSLGLSAIKPVNSGSVSIADAIAKARGIAAEKGLHYELGRNNAPSVREDPRLAGRSYGRSRSRSRTPPRRDTYRDNYNPYRDERRDDARRGGSGGYGRERSISPRGRGNLSPQPIRPQGIRERSPQGRGDDNSEVLTIESGLVGLIIGRQGENLRRVEADSGARVQFIGSNEGPQRQCRISGNPRARADAKRDIYQIVEENNAAKGNQQHDRGSGGGGGGGGGGGSGSGGSGRGNQSKMTNQPALREGENSTQIMVPDRTVGLIIGRGGETIRDLQEKSGCHVNIVGENKSANGLRPVNLIGTHQAATRAKELIMEIVDSDTKNASGSQAPAQRDQGRGPNFDPLGGRGDAFGAGDKINDRIMVPSESVGMIIGKGGENIKDMQLATGCKINVSPAQGADIEREIGLIGSRAAIEDAKRVIFSKVDQVAEKNGSNRRSGGDMNQNQYNDRFAQAQQPYGLQGGLQSMHAQPASTMAGLDPSVDPYAAYGGYANYVAMWYAAMSQQQQAQQMQQGDPNKPPGS